MNRMLRGAFVIGRRDFSATVLSKTFLFFLLGPMFPLLFGGIFGGIGASVASQREKPVVAVVASQSDFDALSAARDRLADAIDESKLVGLVRFAPAPDAAAQQKRLLDASEPPVQAVLTGIPTHPNLTGAIHSGGTTARQVELMLADARATPAQAPHLVVMPTENTSGSLSKDRSVTGQIGQMILFFLTLLLSTMLLSQLVEEKSNKIVEVVAAAVPIESLFVGKLFAMLAASILGLLVWTAAGAAVIASLKQGGLGALPPPATGWPGFLALTVVYFAMNYLLLGAMFLTIGAQASTVREVQTLSMPVTFAQVVIFGFAATSASSPNSTAGLAAAVFPLSSPLAMVGRAAQQPDLWPHVAAITWQILWVALILKLGAKLFRRTVLKSGPRAKWWRRAGKASAVLEPLSEATP
jgi:ABC-2 type transport system permease protein